MSNPLRKQRPPALVRAPAINQWGLVQVGISRRDITVHTQYPVNVNPVKEPPRDDVQSLRQPISVSGYHRYARTHMSVPALAMWDRGVAHVGKFVGHNSERGKMAPAFSRGFTYSSPASIVGAGPGRVVRLGNRRA